MKRLIYLDHNATTPIDPRVLEEMMPYLTTNFANANSSHHFGVDAHEAVKKARFQTAALIGAEPHEVFFTSGATESINLALKGLISPNGDKRNQIITLETEHSAVLDTCRALEKSGYDVVYLPVNSDGLVCLERYRRNVTERTLLVSVMVANNETGVLQPIKEMAEYAHSKGALFFSDATQAVGKILVKVDDLGVDLLAFSGHKFYGPKGVGGLYVRQRGDFKVKLNPLLHGGGHEKGIRSGTLNVPGIVAIGKAADLAKKELAKNQLYVQKLRDYLEEQLLEIPGSKVNGNRRARLFNTTNIHFQGIDSEAAIMGLSNVDDQRLLVAVSNGSACTSTSIEPSHVLIAMRLTEQEAFQCLRFSLGKDNTKEQIDDAISAIHSVVRHLKTFVS